MIGSTIRKVLAPPIWRSLWSRLGDLENALATTEAEIHAQRISRLEAEIAELRVHTGLPPRNASMATETASSCLP